MLGCIPIVKRTYMGKGLYDGLPVLYVTDWNHITPELLESEWKKYVEAPPGTYEWERLFAPYWVKRIKHSVAQFAGRSLDSAQLGSDSYANSFSSAFARLRQVFSHGKH